MDRNIILDYINNAKKNIITFYHIMLGNAYEASIINPLIDKYIDIRYYNNTLRKEKNTIKLLDLELKPILNELIENNPNKTELIKLNPQNVIEELRQNIRMILLTFAGSCPLARELALDSGLIDKPVNIVENIIYANLKRAIEENEPRVNLKQINIKNDLENLGKLVITVIVEVKDEYI